jgi:VWFA-related protein
MLLAGVGAALLWPTTPRTQAAAWDPALVSTTQSQQGPQQGAPPAVPPPQATPTSPQSAAPQQQPGYTINVQSALVRLEVVVTDQDGNVLTGLTKENFRVLQDNAPQQVTNFTPSEAPITMVMLMEYSRLFGGMVSNQGVQWAAPFLRELKPQDWTALITYDMRPHLVVDFTHDPQELMSGLMRLMIPSFSEANMFDALIDTLDRLQDVQGKKSILLIASGFDTFSKHNLDQAYKRLKQTDVTIFCVGMADVMMEYIAEHQQPTTQIGYLQSKNELTTFAAMTGGYSWFPRFYGEMPDIFNSVAAFLRNQYSLGFVPSGNVNDGKYHKIKVDVVDKDGNPMMVADKKGKQKKVIAYARQGFMAPTVGVGD